MSLSLTEAVPETDEQIRGMSVFEVSERYLSGEWPESVEDELVEASRETLEKWADRGYEQSSGLLGRILQPYNFEQQRDQLVENRGQAPHNYSVWSEFWDDIEDGIPEWYSGRKSVKESFRSMKELEWLSEEFGRELDIDQGEGETVYELDLGEWGLGARTEAGDNFDTEPRYAFFRFDELNYHGAMRMMSAALNRSTEDGGMGLATQLPRNTEGGNRIVFDTYFDSPQNDIIGNHMVTDEEGSVTEIDADFSSDHRLETVDGAPTVYITDSSHIRSLTVYEHFGERNDL